MIATVSLTLFHNIDNLYSSCVIAIETRNKTIYDQVYSFYPLKQQEAQCS